MKHSSHGIRCVFVIACAFLAFTCTVPLNAQHDPPCDSVAFLVTIGEMTTDLSPHGITAGDSMVVMPDGHFHLQRRIQQSPSKTATLKIFESSLNKDQLQKLQSILDATHVKELPAYVPASFPLEAPWFGMFEATIVRDSGTQRIGFWVWRGGTPTTAPNTTPEEIKKIWRDSQIALEPLVQWFHEVEATKLEPSPDAKPIHLCGAEEGQH